MRTSLRSVYTLVTSAIMITLLMSNLQSSEAQSVSTNDSKPVSAVVFRDDFDGIALNPDVWQVYTNDGTITVDSGYVTLSQPNAANRFPYVHTKLNPIPSNGNFAVRIGFQYLTVTGHGDGFSVDDRLPANGSPGAWAWQPTIYTLWQDSSLGYVLFDHSGVSRYYMQAPHLSYHDIEFRWLDSTDEYYVDGQLVTTATRDSNVPRPVDLWFGNPVIPPASMSWTSFRIDYIEVVALESPTPFFDLPINYPGRANPTEQQFISAWQGCTTSFFDHRYPTETADNGKGDGYLVLFSGDVITAGTEIFKNSYDGHWGYDFDDLPRCGGTTVLPIAGGKITSAFCDREKVAPYNYKGYGCQIRIEHGDSGYESLYGHLQEDSLFTATMGLVGSTVLPNQQIGTIGCTGKCYGSHLHLNVYYQGKLVDPSGWDGNYDDPYVKDRGGPKSYRLWQYSPRRSIPVNNSLGSSFISASGNVTLTIPPNTYNDDFQVILTEIAPPFLTNHLVSAGHGFVLQARNVQGDSISRFNQNLLVEITFSLSEAQGIQQNTLGLYSWNPESESWVLLPTTISWPATTNNAMSEEIGRASATTTYVGYIALLGQPYLIHLPLISR